MPAPIHGYLGVLRKQGVVGSLFPIRTSLCTIGRGSDCSVRVHQTYISDKHCLITSGNDTESTIESLSLNSATLVNETNLEDNVAVLRHGDIITMGERKFVWQYPESSKFWNNNQKQSLKISPTEFSPKKTVSSPTKMRQTKMSSNSTEAVKVLSTARRQSKSTPLKSGPGVTLKRTASQGKLDSPTTLPDWDQMTSHQHEYVEKQRSRAASFSLRAKKTPERKTSSFQTLAPNMLASLQQKISVMSFGELSESTLKSPNTVYGQLAILRPNGAVGSRLPLSTENCTIGRGLDCSIRVAISTISEQQCLISSQKNQESTITNLSKTSSTLLNGETLNEEATKLCHGDVISMAERYFRWEYPKSSQFWKKLPPDGVVTSRLTNQFGKTNLDMSQKPSFVVDSHKAASLSKSSHMKTKVGLPVGPSNITKKASKSSFTTARPTQGSLKNAVPNSLLSHLDPENMSHLSLKSASTLKGNGNGKRSQPYPFLKSLPEPKKNNTPPSNTVPRKVSSFNNPTANTKTSQTRKLTDKKIARASVLKPGSPSLKKSGSSHSRQMSSADSSGDDDRLSPPLPAYDDEGGISRGLAKINASLFKGFCFSPDTETKLKNCQITELKSSSDSSVPTSPHSVQDNEDDEFTDIAGLIDPIYCNTNENYLL